MFIVFNFLQCFSPLRPKNDPRKRCTFPQGPGGVIRGHQKSAGIWFPLMTMWVVPVVPQRPMLPKAGTVKVSPGNSQGSAVAGDYWAKGKYRRTEHPKRGRIEIEAEINMGDYLPNIILEVCTDVVIPMWIRCKGCHFLENVSPFWKCKHWGAANFWV